MESHVRPYVQFRTPTSSTNWPSRMFRCCRSGFGIPRRSPMRSILHLPMIVNGKWHGLRWTTQ